MLKRDFKLRYRLTNAASIKYNDTDYDEKRLWISRLLAQFMMADVVIVSIDESSFKQEGIPARYWQADARTLRRLFEPAEGQAPTSQDEAAEPQPVLPVRVEEESKQSLPPPESPKSVSKPADPQTPAKKPSIGLTPEMKRLARLRLSSGRRTQPQLLGAAGREGEGAQLRSMADTDSNAARMSEGASEAVAAAVGTVARRTHNMLIKRTEVPRDVDRPLQLAWLQRQKSTERHTAYSFSMIAALTQHCVLAAQITEGGTDAVVFDNFMHQLLTKLRTDKATKSKHIVVLMDNATIHKHSSIYETARRFKVNLLLNAQYSPWLNPVEQLFNHIKRALRKANWRPDREQVCSELQRIMAELNKSKQVDRLWLYSLRAWSETIRLGHFDLS